MADSRRKSMILVRASGPSTSPSSTFFTKVLASFTVCLPALGTCEATAWLTTASFSTNRDSFPCYLSQIVLEAKMPDATILLMFANKIPLDYFLRRQMKKQGLPTRANSLSFPYPTSKTSLWEKQAIPLPFKLREELIPVYMQHFPLWARDEANEPSIIILAKSLPEMQQVFFSNKTSPYLSTSAT